MTGSECRFLRNHLLLRNRNELQLAVAAVGGGGIAGETSFGRMVRDKCCC